MKATLYLMCVSVISIASHAQTLKKRGHNYFQVSDKVGILVDTKIRAVNETGSSPTDGAIVNGINAMVAGSKSTEKYDSVLRKIEHYVDPLESAKIFYQEIYTQKGKSVTMLHLDYLTLPTLVGAGRKTPDKEIHFLKQEYGIDGLVHITVDYGMTIHMKYGIPTWKFARCRIITEIITTSDNSYVVHESMTEKERIDDGWNNPPDYGTLQAAIKLAIRKVLTRQKELYDKL
jgi:hypothetical protein